MPVIPLMAYNVFTVMDETYWKGYPSAESDPYTDPVPNWGNSRVMMVQAQAGQVAGRGSRRRPASAAVNAARR
jgi:peptide/nickel transport system substrate-binding protein